MVTAPTIQIKQYNRATNPTGSRHQEGAGFIRYLSTSPGGTLLHDSINTTVSGAISNSKMFFVRVGNYGSASGIFNMKLYLSDISDWGAGTYRFLERKSTTYITDFQLSEANVDTPTSVPSSPNLFPVQSEHVISGVGDLDVSQFVWTSVLAQSNVPVGIYGGIGGGFRWKLLYDFS